MYVCVCALPTLFVGRMCAYLIRRVADSVGTPLSGVGCRMANPGARLEPRDRTGEAPPTAVLPRRAVPPTTTTSGRARRSGMRRPSASIATTAAMGASTGAAKPPQEEKVRGGGREGETGCLVVRAVRDARRRS